MKWIVPLALFLGAAFLRAEETGPATVEFKFDASAPNGISTATSGDPVYFRSVTQTGGTCRNGSWQVRADAPFGQGQLRFDLDRTNHAGDLALVLHADWQKDTDIAVQLFDAQGRALALDLFGEMKRNAQTVGTDTFVIPLNRYPEATAVVVRRLGGDLRISGGVLYPVMSELSSKAENEKELAAQLGIVLSPKHWLFSAGGKEFPNATGRDPVGNVHTVPSLDKTNAIAAGVLKQPNYPAYRALADGPLVPPKIAASNTTTFMLENALRSLALRANQKPPPAFGFSSDGVAAALLQDGYDVGFMSVPLSSAEKENFFRSRGYPIVELRFARDALEILVNSSNSIRSVTVPQLDAIYGTELRAGGGELIRDWSQLGGTAAGSITAVGGQLNWGTTRTFQKLVLQGGAFRKDMKHGDVVYEMGVEKLVGKDPSAIGFATLRPRPAVRVIAVAANSGEPAYEPNANDIYSGKYPLQRMFYAYVSARSLQDASPFAREFINLMLSDVGQTFIARGGSLPLMASEVVAERSKLGLPQ